MKRIINWSKLTYNLNDNLLFLSALTAIWGSIVYYLYALNWLGIILSLILIISSFIILNSFWGKIKTIENTTLHETALNYKQQKTKLKNRILLIIYALLYLLLIWQLFISRSNQALVSPWQVINNNFFWVYALASLILVLILVKRNINTTLKIFLISGHYLISLSVALIIYKIAYGFDPFIHQAAMKLISTKGIILPKTPYYLGEYSIIIIIHKISGLTIALLNKILVPVLSALFLPLAFYRFLKKRTTSFPLSVLFILILTFSPFILTTPQNLSYLFLILTVLAGFNYTNLSKIWLLALATAAIHPLTGLPALAFTLWLTFKKYENEIKPIYQKISKPIIFIFMLGALPLALLWGGGGHWKNLGSNYWLFFEPLKNLLAQPGMIGQEDWLSNLIYFLANNYNLFLIIALIGAIFYYYKTRKNNKANQVLKESLILMSFALLITYLLSRHIIFNDLISYERANYANRLPIIIVIFLLPFLLIGLNKIITKIQQQKNIIKIIYLIFGIGLLSVSLYLSYPRWDKYHNSHGYSTSINDIRAVKSIAQNAKQNYLVLADQQVSAAALQELGFKHYYKTNLGQVYFYPIPTGGPLYQYYLKMVYDQPSPKNMIGALRLVGVNTGYLVINRYWHHSGRLIKEAKLNALESWNINKQVYIFKYKD